MTTYLLPVAPDLERARGIAQSRLSQRGSPPWWDIRKGFDGYYVVPPMDHGVDISGYTMWKHDPGYESLGSFVERVSRE